MPLSDEARVLAARLYLQDPDEYAQRAIQENRVKFRSQCRSEKDWKARYMWRGTGKTVRMILEALVVAQQGENVCFTHDQSPRAHRMHQMAKEFAKELGIDIKLLHSRPSAPHFHRGRSMRVFVDPEDPIPGLMPYNEPGGPGKAGLLRRRPLLD
jgi:hypothetical protein